MIYFLFWIGLIVLSLAAFAVAALQQKRAAPVMDETYPVTEGDESFGDDAAVAVPVDDQTFGGGEATSPVDFGGGDFGGGEFGGGGLDDAGFDDFK